MPNPSVLERGDEMERIAATPMRPGLGFAQSPPPDPYADNVLFWLPERAANDVRRLAEKWQTTPGDIVYRAIVLLRDADAVAERERNGR